MLSELPVVTLAEVGSAAVQCDPVDPTVQCDLVDLAAAESRGVVGTACGDTVAVVQSAVVDGDPCYPCHPVDSMVAVSEGLSASHRPTLLIETPVDSHTQSTADGAVASHARSKPVRRRVAEPLLWKKTQRKRKRNSGQAYINAAGKFVSAKSMQVVNCTKCRFRCSENFSEEKRLQIFTQYYALADYSRQKDFLASHIVEASPKKIRLINRSPETSSDTRILSAY